MAHLDLTTYLDPLNKVKMMKYKPTPYSPVSPSPHDQQGYQPLCLGRSCSRFLCFRNDKSKPKVINDKSKPINDKSKPIFKMINYESKLQASCWFNKERERVRLAKDKTPLHMITLFIFQEFVRYLNLTLNTGSMEHCLCFPREDMRLIFALGNVSRNQSLGQYFPIHSLGSSC